MIDLETLQGQKQIQFENGISMELDKLENGKISVHIQYPNFAKTFIDSFPYKNIKNFWTLTKKPSVYFRTFKVNPYEDYNYNDAQKVMEENFAEYLDEEDDMFGLVSSIYFNVSSNGNGLIEMHTRCELNEDLLQTFDDFIDSQLSDGVGGNSVCEIVGISPKFFKSWSKYFKGE